MAQTPFSSGSAYVTPVQALQHVAPQVWADVLRAYPDAPRPSYMAMIDSTNPAGERLLVYLGVGAGEIEAAMGVAGRYTYLDLQALTGVSATLLQALNAYRGLWSAFKYLRPGTARPEDCPGAKESAELIKSLREGENVFSFSEAQEAGNPSVVPPNTALLVTPDVVGRAHRIFPGYGVGPWQNRRGC